MKKRTGQYTGIILKSKLIHQMARRCSWTRGRRETGGSHEANQTVLLFRSERGIVFTYAIILGNVNTY